MNNCKQNNGCYSSCGCNNNYHNNDLDSKPLAMAYVPWQRWQKPLCASDGFMHGTIFSDLILPFYGCKPTGNQNYRRGGGH